MKKRLLGIFCAMLCSAAFAAPIAEVEYFYAKDGTLTGRAVNGVRQNYEYDRRGQLLDVVDAASGKSVESYRYDKAGNLLKKTVRGETTEYTYDAANQLTQIAVNGRVIRCEYDAAGRLVQEGDKTYTYGYLDKILAIQENGRQTATFDYYVDGQIASATHGGKSESFLWDGLALIHRGETSFVNEPAITGGNPILSSKDGVMFNDMLGNTLGTKSAEAFSPVNMTAFGETSDKSAMFTGKPYIGDLGYAFLFRNYRPELAKWQTSDPLGYPDGWNNLAYCENNVINYVDFLGALKLRSRTIVWAGVSYTHTWISSDDGKTTLSGIPSNENYSGGSGSGSSGSGESAGGNETNPATLVYRENYDLDINAKSFDEIDIPLNGKTEQAVLDEMKKKAKAYNGELPYDPVASGDAYNSNSLTAGILNATGYNGSSLVESLPGVQPGSGKPVPKSSLE